MTTALIPAACLVAQSAQLLNWRWRLGGEPQQLLSHLLTLRVGGKGVKGQQKVQRLLGREAAGACVQGWWLSPCLSRVHVRLSGGEGGVWAAGGRRGGWG
eukprot:3793043-Rhodomonas_salina.1